MMIWPFQLFLMEIRKLITYRADFWANFIGTTFFSLIIAYYLWKSIFFHTQSEVMSGHTMQSMIFYYLIAPLLFRIQQGQGIGFISREIYDGQLNKYLLYPTNIFKMKEATYFAHSAFFLFQFFVILISYNYFFYDPEVYTFSVVNLGLFLLDITLITILFFYLFTICEFMAFWFDNIWSLGVILRFGASFLGGGLIPLIFFPDWAQTILQYTPFPYLIDFPFKLLTGKMITSDILPKFLITFGWLLLFKFISRFIWNRGKYQYSGVGI